MRVRIILLSLVLSLATFPTVGQNRKTVPSETTRAAAPGDIRLLEGYRHIRRTGIDTAVGDIRKDGGVIIRYDIGRLAGLYAARCMTKGNCVWFKRQSVNGSEVWLGLTKEEEIIATFRNDYANFFAQTKSSEDIADFLTIVLTYHSNSARPAGVPLGDGFLENCDKDIVITIARSSCFGYCPVYSAEIHANGEVVYVGRENVKEKGERRFKISQETIQQLVKEFERVDYFSLKYKYDADENGMSVTDLPTTTTSLCLDGKKKTVVNYYGAPKRLFDLEDKIDSLAGITHLLIGRR